MRISFVYSFFVWYFVRSHICLVIASSLDFTAVLWHFLNFPEELKEVVIHSFVHTSHNKGFDGLEHCPRWAQHHFFLLLVPKANSAPWNVINVFVLDYLYWLSRHWFSDMNSGCFSRTLQSVSQSQQPASRVESGSVLLPLTVAVSTMSHLWSVCWLKTHCLCSPLCFSSFFLFVLLCLSSLPSDLCFDVDWPLSFLLLLSSSSLDFLELRQTVISYLWDKTNNQFSLFLKLQINVRAIVFPCLSLSFFSLSSCCGCVSAVESNAVSCWWSLSFCLCHFVLLPCSYSGDHSSCWLCSSVSTICITACIRHAVNLNLMYVKMYVFSEMPLFCLIWYCTRHFNICK